MSEPIVVLAPAKLTVSLTITGTRSDGLHLIDAEMVTLDLHDTLTITPGGEGISVSGPFAVGVPTDATNLVARALTLTGRRAAIHLAKSIPHGGGLGGGSADAAAVLRWAHWRDVGGAAAIGADVAFCLVGGRARVRGIGDVVEPLPPIARTFTLVIPPLHCPTGLIYRTWDDLGGPAGEFGNDLEPAALAVVPEMRQWRERITEAAGAQPRLAGSGSTWFLDGERRDLATLLPDADVVVTHTV